MKNLVFLTHDDVRTWGSTLARSEQMAELSLRAFGPKKINISYTSDPEVYSSLVIANKGFLERASLETLEQLQGRGNIIIAD